MEDAHNSAELAPAQPKALRGEIGAPASKAQGEVVRFLSALWRGKWWILLCATVTLFAGGYYAYRVADNVFRSEVWLTIRVQDTSQVVDIESVVSGIQAEPWAINTELDILRSRELLSKLAVDLNLVEDPEFNALLQPEPVMSRAKIRNYVLSLFGEEIAEAPAPAPHQIDRWIVDALRGAVSVSAKSRTYLYSVTVRSSSPEKAALIANRLAELYLEEQIQVKFEATEFAVDWLSRRVAELESEVSDNEDAIKELRSSTELISFEALEALNIRSKDIRQRFQDAERDVLVAQARLRNIVTLSESEEYKELSNLLNDPILRRAITEADRQSSAAETGQDDSGPNDSGEVDSGQDEASEVVPRPDPIAARVDVLRKSTEDELGRLIAQRDALDISLAEIRQQTDEQNADLQALNQLAREVEASQVLYETFLARLKETSLQIGLLQADSRIMSVAVPGVQVAPRRSVLMAFSLMLGVLFATGVLILRTFLYQGIRSSAELEQLTGHVTIGQTPVIPARSRQKVMHYLENKPTSASAEAIRNLRTSILSSDFDNPPQIIMSTSSVPAEGKTTQSLALAHNLAGLGKRVLLVEGDIRRRTFLHYFKTKPPGNLISVLSGKTSLKEAVLENGFQGVDVLVGGKSKINAADAFASRTFADLIQTMRADYDYVVIDTPPVLVVPDARVIGRHVDSTVYSVKWNSTGQNQILSGIRELASAGVRITGLVLTQVKPRELRRYGYGTYGRYSRGYYEN